MSNYIISLSCLFWIWLWFYYDHVLINNTLLCWKGELLQLIWRWFWWCP